MVQCNHLLDVFFLNQSIPRQRTGVESAAILRARVFAEDLGIAPIILTLDYNPHFEEIHQELLQSGLIAQRLRICNLYEHIQESKAITTPPGNPQSPSSPHWQTVSVPGTPDLRIHDQHGKLIMYRKYSRNTGTLEHINFFHQGKKWRRDTFTGQGVLSRIQHLDAISGLPVCEYYLRPDGSIAMVRKYSADRSNPRLETITLMSRYGNCVNQFEDDEQLLLHWLETLTSNLERTCILVCDRNLLYYRPAQSLLASGRRPNVYLVPVIHSVHTKDSSNVQRSATKLAYAGILRNLQAPSAIVVGTEQQKTDIAARYGSGNIHVIAPAYAEKGRTATSSPQTREYRKLVYVGRYSAEKNHAIAIRAFAKVLQALTGVTLHLYGYGPEKQNIAELVKQLHLQDYVFIHGFTNDVQAVYRSAGMSLLTSGGEGYSLGVLESLSGGCPVAAFDVNYGPASMIRSGKNGVLVPFGNVDQLAFEIVKVLSDRARHDLMCRAAEEITSKFSRNAIAEKWGALLEELPQYRFRPAMALKK